MNEHDIVLSAHDFEGRAARVDFLHCECSAEPDLRKKAEAVGKRLRKMMKWIDSKEV
ncbi:MAG TPA: hypothetical protein VNC50_08865 [Planctomycetia bacterium]|nr:hypothetical protein [Planctomycetia bacterium]